MRPASWPYDDVDEASSDDEGGSQEGTPLLDSPGGRSACAPWDIRSGGALVEDAASAAWVRELDLRPYVNRSNMSVRARTTGDAPACAVTLPRAQVPHTFSVQRAYIAFRTLGLRHMPVVEEANRVVGIVTRKELLRDALRDRLAASGAADGAGAS